MKHVRITVIAAACLAALGGIGTILGSWPEHSVAQQTLMDRPTSVHYSYVPNYIPVSPYKREMNGRFGPDFRTLRDRIQTLSRDGHEPICSTQILSETRNLINYTNDEEAVRGRLADLQDSLAETDQSHAYRQSPLDGSWGGCFRDWYLRMHASVDPMKELALAGRRPKHPLGFLAPVDTPAKLRDKLESLLISEPGRTGVDNRKQLNLVITGLAQLLFRPELAAMLPSSLPVAELAAALQDFLDNRAQDPQTGFWGAWYVVDGEIRKTNDLSITFHAISYRSSDPPRLKEMADTLFAIRTARYPYGWRDQGTQNNHHAYDVARLLRRAWPHMSPEQRARCAAELTIMVARSLNVSISADGSFDEMPYDSAAEAYYFGVSFLDEVGLFRQSQSFWTPMVVSNPDSLREVLHGHLRRHDQRHPMIAAALRKLEARE
jgi:hypothetical protein